MRNVKAIVAGAMLALGNVVVQGAVITYLGQDATSGGDWRNSGVAKSSTFDPNGDGVYGSDGYHMAVYVGGNLVRSALPSYVSGLTAPVSPFTMYGKPPHSRHIQPSRRNRISCQ